MKVAGKRILQLSIGGVVLLIAAASCQQRYSPASDSSTIQVMAPIGARAEDKAMALGAMPAIAARRTSADGDRVYAGGTAANAHAPALAFAPAATSMVIRNGDVSIQVDSVEASIEQVRKVATSLGGYVGNVAMNTGEHQVPSATLELKVPAARFDEAMAGVRPIGQVERSTATVEDVGEQFVDVMAEGSYVVPGTRVQVIEIGLRNVDTERANLAVNCHL